jgi:hypothetical protein
VSWLPGFSEEKMIITKLLGGLGNQMFQYAVGRQLALQLGLELRIDTAAFEEYKLHQYGLDKFDIQAPKASTLDIEDLKFVPENKLQQLYRKLRHKPRQVSTHYFRETKFDFNAEILNITGSVFLDGYWQSERYFKASSAQIRQDFSVKEPLKGKNKEIYDLIKSSPNAVSLHIRRGDYAKNEATKDFHGLCALDYYQKGLDLLQEKLGELHIFVFSDDIAWAQVNLVTKQAITFVGHNGPDKNYEDLRLMSSCEHHIIANSSFSWWGAWLNESAKKIVIAPKKWFAVEGSNPQDLIPKNWLRL